MVQKALKKVVKEYGLEEDDRAVLFPVKNVLMVDKLRHDRDEYKEKYMKAKEEIKKLKQKLKEK
ncbi:MAG: hypothetical protein ACTSWY_16350 [Promethearchaeota archaeon]